jgi:hypothetical protein
MWAFSYLAVAFLAPGVSGDVNLGVILYGLIYVWIVVTFAVYVWGSQTIGRISFFILGIFSTFSGVASWTGVAIWNVPFANKELFQVSMAFADLISAAFMFFLAIAKTAKNIKTEE